MGHSLPELLSDEGHEGVRQLQHSIKGIHQHLQVTSIRVTFVHRISDCIRASLHRGNTP